MPPSRLGMGLSFNEDTHASTHTHTKKFPQKTPINVGIYISMLTEGFVCSAAVNKLSLLAYAVTEN